MRCLSCTKTISETKAVYTKPCRHVFCMHCSSKKFKEELVCPLCDTVLPKDGVVDINLRPDKTTIQKASEPGLGMQPKYLCQILQNGLEFWAQQQQNENSIHLQTQKRIKEDFEEEKALNRKLTLSLENERLRSSSLTRENEDLVHQVSDLEKRYTEKSRSFRKLNEAYTELRRVHKKLESDLRGTQIDADIQVEEEIHRQTEKEKRGQDVDSRRRNRHAQSRSDMYESSRRAVQERPRSPSVSRSLPLSIRGSGRGSAPSTNEPRYDFKLDSKRSRQESMSRTEPRPRRNSRDGRGRDSVSRRGESSRYDHQTRDAYD